MARRFLGHLVFLSGLCHAGAVYPSWPAAFAALAEEQGFDITDVEEAARQVREMIVLIDAATE